jgi:hypothetical protein
MECIKEEVFKNPVSNLLLLSEEDLKKQEELMNRREKYLISREEPMEVAMESPMVDEGPTDMEVTEESALDMRVENRYHGELTVGDMRGGTAAYNTGFDIGMARG